MGQLKALYNSKTVNRTKKLPEKAHTVRPFARRWNT